MFACSSTLRLLFTSALTKLLFTFMKNEFMRFQVYCCIMFCVETEIRVLEAIVVAVIFFSIPFKVDKIFMKYTLNSVQVFA